MRSNCPRITLSLLLALATCTLPFSSRAAKADAPGGKKHWLLQLNAERDRCGFGFVGAAGRDIEFGGIVSALDMASSPNHDVSTFPCDGSRGVARATLASADEPHLRTAPIGAPVLINAAPGQVLRINQVSMREFLSRKPLAMRRPVTAESDHGGGLQSHQAWVAAQAPLRPNTQYEVTIDGDLDTSHAFRRSFVFTTTTR